MKIRRVEYGRDGRPLDRPLKEKAVDVFVVTATILFLAVIIINILE